jgi:hypothetical protein
MKTTFTASLLLCFTMVVQAGQVPGYEKRDYGTEKVISIYSEKNDPVIRFGIEELKKSLTGQGYKVIADNLDNSDIKIITVNSEPELAGMKLSSGDFKFFPENEGFIIRKDKKDRIWVAGGGTAGTMYGILELAEQVRLYGTAKITVTEKNPYMKVRGIKFNLPLDVRTPSYSDFGDAGQINIPVVWDFKFWTNVIDNLARNRYNLISLWNLHPFPSMVKVPEYPDVALADVRRASGKLAENYDGRGRGFDKPEITGTTETVLKISIDDKIAFWQKVMRYGKERNVSFLIMTWNIFTYGTQGKYGITDDMNNQVTRDYFRKSVRQMFFTYPDLAGIGITTGENMGNAGEGFDLKEDWIYDAYGRGILDVIEKQPERKITFVHRQHEAGTTYIISKFKPLEENRNIRFLFSFKYAQAHVYSSVKQTFHTQFLKDITGMKTLWTLRNDDNFYFRWGAPDFVRTFIKNIPSDVSEGYYYGSDNYIWGKDFLSRNPEIPGQLELERHWYSWLLWGRLGYDPGLPDERFVGIISARFPGTDAAVLFSAWQSASMIYPVTTGFHWGALDFQWYIEGCKSQPDPAQTKSGFHDVNRFITLQPHPGTGYQSIPDYVTALTEKRNSQLISPVKVAEMLFNYGDSALRLIGKIDAGNKELSNITNDIRSMAYLGEYYSYKIKGAVSLALYRKTGDKKAQDDAVIQLTTALKTWNLYTESALKQYKNPLWTNRVGLVDWVKLTDEVKKDIDIARQ